MNEILNQRIQSIQAGKDITHAQIIAKRNLREELDVALMEYLANGGEINKLKINNFKLSMAQVINTRNAHADAMLV